MGKSFCASPVRLGISVPRKAWCRLATEIHYDTMSMYVFVYVRMYVCVRACGSLSFPFLFISMQKNRFLCQKQQQERPMLTARELGVQDLCQEKTL